MDRKQLCWFDAGENVKLFCVCSLCSSAKNNPNTYRGKRKTIWYISAANLANYI